MIPRVAILLAAYDGQEFIREQIFSILHQCNVKIDIYIRVDGDNLYFRDLVKNFSAKYLNIFYIEGDILSSPAKNFFNLILKNYQNKYDYYALCDQDDIWFEDKISNAINYFHGNLAQGFSTGVKAFYLNGKNITIFQNKIVKYDYYFQSAGAGCTYVINREGFFFIQNYLINNKELLNISSHDWLIYFVFRYNNIPWIYGKETKIWYRQHSNNIAGINKGLKAKLKRIKILFKGWYFDDLLILLKFSINKNTLPLFYNPFNLRRTLFSSIIIWFYYWLYVLFNI
jgi:rhamnosyltransferase